MLDAVRRAEAEGLSGEAAVMEAFEAKQERLGARERELIIEKDLKRMEYTRPSSSGAGTGGSVGLKKCRASIARNAPARTCDGACRRALAEGAGVQSA